MRRRRKEPPEPPPQLDEMVSILNGVARILMEIDAKLETIVELLEDEDG